MRKFKSLILVAVFTFFIVNVFADVWQGPIEHHDIPTDRTTARCEPGRTSTELYINNVRTLIHTGGDMWWDLQGRAQYEVPAGGGAHSLFAGSIWVGGLDANGQLKLAAMKFRQRGVDYWPGPLIASGEDIGTVSQQVCRDWDRHFVIRREQVAEFRSWYDCTQNPDCDADDEFPGYTIPEIIMNWPAHGPPGGYDHNLAPFWDVSGDGYYNPLNGDFPYFEFMNEGITDDPDCRRPRDRMPKLFGDHTLWWVYNDRGNIHTETGADPIGMEFRAQAFAFSTNDELNNMTFYNYNIINRSTFILYDTYFGVWVDPDVGYPRDDYIGCDVSRGLGYCYNGEDYDRTADGVQGYGWQPPAVGVKFFEGPYQDPDGMDNPSNWDTIDGVRVLDCNLADFNNGNINGLNFGDGTIDNERWGMRRFIYFNNSGGGHHPATLDPATAIEHYNFLTGYWKDGTPLCYGGTGHYAGGGDLSTPTDFMFPGVPTTDPCGWGQGGQVMGPWSEETEENPPGDRRFIQSAGPFTLEPGAVNDITTGIVWSRASSGGPWASVELMRTHSDAAQTLFENCFRILSGPDAPELNIIELDRKLIFHIYNRPNSNNYLEEYIELDPSIVCLDPDVQCTPYYEFQGYQVFQFRDNSVSISERYDRDRVRQVFQCDIKDDVDKIVNYVWDNDLGANQPVLEVQGNNEGIQNTFVIEYDAFAPGDARLINNREYYFSIIAYAYNDSELYDQTSPDNFYGQRRPYLAGRNNIRVYTATPHLTDPDGTIMQSEYGFGPQITQIEGHGNSENRLEMTQETVDEIMSGYPWRANTITYEHGMGPINVKVIDPLNVPEGHYTLKFIEPTSNVMGVIGTNIASMNITGPNYRPFEYMIYNTEGDTIFSESMVRYSSNYEQLIPEWGISIDIYQSGFSGYMARNKHPRNGFIHASMEFEDPQKPWLDFIPDETTMDHYNWIRVGTFRNRANEIDDSECGAFRGFNDYLVIGEDNEIIGYDPRRHYAQILGGRWAPYYLTSGYRFGPALEVARSNQNIIEYEPISSVDLVITNDRSKWTRSAVVEMCENEWEINEDCINQPFPHWEESDPKVNYRSEGGALRFSLRQSPSVNKDGEPDDSGTYGLGWFPGYAIDVRTGERLNIVFGEDSWLAGANGNDMIWNPTSEVENMNGPVFGGKHFIYIMGNTYNREYPPASGVAYDSCKLFHSKLVEFDQTGNSLRLREAWQSAMWTAMPILRPGFDLLETDVTIRLRVANPYRRGVEQWEKENPYNDNYPMFTFSTADVKTIHNDRETAESALDLIRVVPNPYYGNSYYERNQLDNYVRITNLPRRCVISIYNINGTLIRQFDKDSDAPYVQWNLKNHYGIEIASGLYIIHVDAPGIGEKIVKWFGALRPVDLNNF